jgi:hypothetical protein
MRIGIASLTLVLAVASLQSSAVAATAPAGESRTGVENFVSYVYENLLVRAPDQAGLTYWTDHVEQHGPGPFVNAVVHSEEWRRLWVSEYFARWLHRHPDDGGRAYWVDYLAGHGFAAFESLLGGSDEAYGLSGGTDAAYVDEVYLKAAYREPDENEHGSGLTRLETGSRSDLVSFVLLHGDGLVHRVHLSYRMTLRREPDPAGAEHWIAQYHNTGDWAGTLAGMMLSPEAWETAQRNG